MGKLALSSPFSCGSLGLSPVGSPWNGFSVSTWFRGVLPEDFSSSTPHFLSFCELQCLGLKLKNPWLHYQTEIMMTKYGTDLILLQKVATGSQNHRAFMLETGGWSRPNGVAQSDSGGCSSEEHIKWELNISISNVYTFVKQNIHSWCQRHKAGQKGPFWAVCPGTTGILFSTCPLTFALTISAPVCK